MKHDNSNKNMNEHGVSNQYNNNNYLHVQHQHVIVTEHAPSIRGSSEASPVLQSVSITDKDNMNEMNTYIIGIHSKYSNNKRKKANTYISF